MEDIELIRLKEMLLEMMKDIHRVCEENNIRYYLVGGTLLGAIRHKGFIPWDDDIDISMPRSDYEKFIQIANEKLEDKHRIEHVRSRKDFPYSFIKVNNINTTVIEEPFKNTTYKGGIYIDIFPLDGTYKNRILREIQYHRVEFYRQLKGVVLVAPKTANKYKVVIGKILNSLIGKNINTNKIAIKIDKIARECDYEKSKIITNFSGAWGKRETVNKELFGKPTKYIFEGNYFYGVEKYDKYLRCIYGNYMELPPVEKRTSRHSFYEINLEKSYLEQ